MAHLLAGVLAGGGSRRYGRDKAFVRYEGRTLIEHALEAVDSVADESCILSKESEAFSHLAHAVIPDITGIPTPISGIISVIPFVRDWLLLAACDIFVRDPSFLLRLWEARETGRAVIPRTERGLQPLLALYPREHLHYWEDAFRRGAYKLRPVAEKIPHLTIETRNELARGGSAEWAGEYPPFVNINRPQDLAAFRSTQ
jgi:molybdenum cofactor guanylyltransferase